MSFWQRVGLACVTELGYWAILGIGRTIRWRTEGWANLEAVHREGSRFVGAFWHNRILMTAYFLRHRGIVAMISRHRDGEYIARVSRRLGFAAARGSGSRGGRGAVVELLRALRRGRDVLVTLDGPRGPRYRAKPGAAYVAGKTGSPVLPFTVAVDRSWALPSWDGFIVPKPFSRALVIFGTPIRVGPHPGPQELGRIQSAMDDLGRRGDAWLEK